jgi:hypothetical protein
MSGGRRQRRPAGFTLFSGSMAKPQAPPEDATAAAVKE